MVIQQLALVSVTCFPEGLPFPVTTPTHIWCENAKGSFETVIFRLMVNVSMENCGDSTANACIRDLFPGGGCTYQSLNQHNRKVSSSHCHGGRPRPPPLPERVWGNRLPKSGHGYCVVTPANSATHPGVKTSALFS